MHQCKESRADNRVTVPEVAVLRLVNRYLLLAGRKRYSYVDCLTAKEHPMLHSTHLGRLRTTSNYTS